MVVRLKQSTTFAVQAIPQPSQANPDITFNGQWLTEKISDNIDNLMEIRLCVQGIQGIVTANISYKVQFPTIS